MSKNIYEIKILNDNGTVKCKFNTFATTADNALKLADKKCDATNSRHVVTQIGVITREEFFGRCLNFTASWDSYL